MIEDNKNGVQHELRVADFGNLKMPIHTTRNPNKHIVEHEDTKDLSHATAPDGRSLLPKIWEFCQGMCYGACVCSLRLSRHNVSCRRSAVLLKPAHSPTRI